MSTKSGRRIAKIAEAGEYLDGLKKELSFKVYDAYLGVDEAKKGLELAKSPYRRPRREEDW